MAEDIFMNYAASSSPIDSDQVQAPKIQLNITKFGNNFDEILFARDKISTNLKSSTSGSSQETRLKILQLRQFNRHLSNLITEHRKRLNELKEIVDTLNSKLLCEKFEKQHLLDEIKTCLNSKNIFQTIELEPLEDSDPLLEVTDPHELMIKRLQRELAQRQELQAQLISILQRKQQTELELEKTKRKIEDLKLHLQNLIKNSKPLIDACGYDVDGFHHKQRMAIDEVTTTENNSKTTENEEGIEVIYEKLVSFIEEKPNFKLRCFDALVTKATEEDKEVLEEEGRDSSIKTAYIQIKMDMEAIEAIEIFLKLSEYSSNLLLKFQHEFFTENSISTWLKGLETVEFSEIETNWLAPVKLQPDSLNFSKDADEFFSAISEAFKLRNQLQNLVQDNFELLEFDKTDPNEIFLLPEKKLKAKITGNSIVWSLVEADGNVEDLISSLNSIGTKFRSVLDCLQAQIELLK